jgi:hypothetical protein
LLQYGADKTLVSPSLNTNPLQLAKQLQEKQQVNYGKIIELLGD